MIIYFANRLMEILGHATTTQQKGFTITEDLKTEEIETGVATFSCKIGFTKENRLRLEEMTDAGNYLLRSNGNENEFYTIIETEIDTKNQEIYIYAEDAGLDLINEVAAEFEATQSYNAEWYINKYIVDSGFEIGINEIPSNTTRKLSWSGESSVTERLASIANSFGGYEISFSFDIKGLEITNKYINIYKERGKELGEHLRLNRDIDRIVTTKTVANLATAFVCEGATPERAEGAKEDPPPISLKGYKYDDGDFYVDGDKLKARTANKRWSRYIWNKEPNRLNDGEGYIVRPYFYDTLSQAELCSRALTELKKACEMEVNYEIDIKKLSEGVKIGDRINIVDDADELYVSSRILKLESSAVDNNYTATLGEHLIKTSGISQKVIELAEQFAAQTISVKRAQQIANNAVEIAENAQTQAEEAAAAAENALSVSEEAKTAANTAAQSAATAQAKAAAAENKANEAENSVAAFENALETAQQAADNAQIAASTAQTKAEEAKTAAANAQKEATEAKEAAGTAQSSAASAISKAETAQDTADIAKTEAEAAIETAAAAKIDAAQAEEDIKSFEESLETLKDTMSAEYARKTELTETTANLQTQISKNAAELSSTASKVTIIDETVNNAADRVEAAQKAATLAQEQADEASEKAEAAQTAADEAQQAADTAQAEADTAKEAAATARSVLDQAEAELKAAKVELEIIKAKAGATEEEIAEAQSAVNTAQEAADVARANARAAIENAATAQNTADLAVINAANAQQAANKAVNEASLAQLIADEAKGNAEEAQAIAAEAAALAEAAQETANTARATADSAQNIADNARAEADEAQVTAEEAAQILSKANLTLESATERLAGVMENAEATEEEIAEAQAAVDAAQTAADEAATNAENAQTAADNAKAEAEAAQAEADTAKAAADEAQQAAQEAQTIADKAQGAVAGLFKRITEAESKITQTAEGFTSTVKEVQRAVNKNATNILNSQSAIQQLADSISMLVTDGNGTSLMTQTENGWTFSTAKIQSDINSTSQILNDLVEQFGSTDAVISVLQQAVDDIGVKTDYINIGTYSYENDEEEDVTEPCIELGESDNDYKVLITNTQILFKAGSATPTRINTDGLITENITVINETRHTHAGWGVDSGFYGGMFVWAARANGHYGLQWKGPVG